MQKDTIKNDKKIRRKEILNRAVRFILFAIISFIIGTSVYKINAKKLTHNQLPAVFGYSSAVVLSGSMEPTLSIDDLIIVKVEEKYNINDVVVYQENNSLVVHRIIKADENGYVTQGDANNTADEPITPDQVKGKVIMSVSHVGKAMEFIKSPFCVLAIIAVIVVLLELSYKKEKKTEKTEIELLQEEIELLKAQKEDRENKEE